MLDQVRRHQVEVAGPAVGPRRQHQDVGGGRRVPNWRTWTWSYWAGVPGHGRRGDGHDPLGRPTPGPRARWVAGAGGDGGRRGCAGRGRGRARRRAPAPGQEHHRRHRRQRRRRPPAVSVACLPPRLGPASGPSTDPAAPQDKLAALDRARLTGSRSRAVAVARRPALGHQGPAHPLGPARVVGPAGRGGHAVGAPPVRHAVPRPAGPDPGGPSRRTGTGPPTPRPSPGPGPGRAGRPTAHRQRRRSGQAPAVGRPGGAHRRPRGRAGPGRTTSPGPGGTMASTRACASAARTGRPATRAGEHPAGVGVDHADVALEGEGQDGPGRVGAHAGERQQVGEVVGHRAAVAGPPRPGPPAWRCLARRL